MKKTVNRSGKSQAQAAGQKPYVPAASLGKGLTPTSIMALEPRMVFDGAMAAQAADTVVRADQQAVSGLEGAPADVAENGPETDLAGLAKAVAAHITVPEVAREAAQSSSEIAFVDSSLEDLSTLLAAVPDNVEIILLDPNRDGVDQIAQALIGRREIGAIHILSHGSEGNLYLGTAELRIDNMSTAYATDMAIIRSALAVDADILIYGCEFASGLQGQAAANELARLTGADVAASSDMTGAASLLGDWQLEERTGNIEASTFDATDWDHLLVQTTINPTGGVATNGSDGLAIFVTNDGQFQVRYQNMNQYYSQGATDSSTNLFNGMYLAVGTQVIGPDTGAEGMTKVAWQSIGVQTLTGTGTVADPFIVTTGMYYDQNTNTAYDAATDTLLTVRTIYSYPNKYFTQEVTVTPPATNNSVIKFYHAMDTFLGGGDQGPAFSLNPELAITNNTSGDPSFVGVRKGVGTATESIVGFAEIAGGGSFTRYYSDVYNGANLYSNGIANGGDIINTWNTNPLTDNAIAVQFTLGAISSPQTISYHIAFDGDTKLDLDADNSTATGTSYLGTFPVSTGEPVNIVDSDVQITNVIGDIADATVTLTNPQSGDALTVDTALLPAGITVEARSANTITISGIGTEADYLTALKLIKFSTTSGIVTNRSFTVEIHNQLNSVTTTASSTLSGVFSPIVDLNSGLLAVPSTNNIVVNGTFSDYADKPYGWSEAGTGITTDSAITGRYAFTANAADSLTKTGLTGLNVGPSPAGGGQLTLDLGWVNTGTNRTLTISVAGTNYATLNTSTGALTYLNGASGSPASIAAMGSATGTLTAITINLPSTVAATGSLVFSTTAGVDDIYLDNVRLLTTVIDYTDQTSGDDWTATFTQNGSAVAISDTDADVRDGDSANMTSGVVTITNAQIGDRLLVAGSTAASGTISGISYTNTGTVVTLTGSASKASYAAAIRAISFEHTTGNAEVGIVRDITVRVNDGTNPSNDAHSYITVVDPGPTLDLDSNDSAAGSFAYTTTYSEGGAPVAIADADPSITDPNDANMESATITLTNQQPGDRLLVAGSSVAFGTLPSGIAWTRTDTTVVLNGSYSIAQYQVALQLIQFESPSESPPTTPRIINTVVSDGSNNSNTAVATINVTSIDDAPVATITPTTYAATEQTALSLKGTGLSISDVDAGSGNVTVTLSVADGQLSVTAGGSGAAVSGSGTSSVTINGTVAQINALLGSDATSVVSYINSSNSPVASTLLTLSINDNGNTGSGGPLSASDTATITIQAVNDAPVATITPVSYAATEQAALTLKGTGLSVSDVDAGAASMTVTLSVTSGTLTVTTGGSGAGVSGSGSSSVTISGTAAQINALLGADPTSIVSYTNTSDAPPASATLTLAINDNGNTGAGGALTGSDTAAINITPINDAPSGTSATLTVAEDGFYTFSAADFGFSDVDGNAFQSVTITTPPLNGTLTLGGGAVVAGQVIPVGSLGTLVFTPAANANGAGYAVFTFQVRDSGGTANGGADFDSTPNSITINVTPVNDNPVAVNDAITIAEDASATIVPVLANDSFAPDVGETLSVSAVTRPANGTVTLVSGVVRYTPNADFNGTDTFTYTLSDGNGGTATGTVTVTVTAVNDNPVAVNDAITVAEDATATIVPVLANDTFAPDAGETLSVSAVTQPANGTVTLVSGVVRYTPNADFNGTDTFTYTVSDGNGGTATGTVTVTVTASNDAPVAVNDAITVAEDATATIVPVLANDTFAPDAGETLSVSAVTQPANGTVTLVSGVVRYTPNADFNGTDTFTYTVSDGNCGTATGTVTVTVTASNDAPVAVNDAITVAEDATATIVPVLANDSFAPDAGETLSVSAVTQPANGSVTLVSGVVRYTPNADFNGIDTFTYTLSDGNGGTATGTVTVTVTAVNDNPVAVNDAITVAEDATATIVPVLANDSFAPDVGETLSVSAVTQPANGTVTLVSGVVRYTPNADFNGTDTFTYTVSDGNGGTATGTVTVTVTASNDAPVAVNDAITVAEDATATIVPVLANDTFAPDAGETLSVSAVTQPANGTVTLVSGVVRYTPNADFNGIDTFTYTLSDGNGGTATGTVTVTVTAVNDNPVAVNDAITIAEDATATIVPVLANDSFAPDVGETLSVSAVTQPANGTVTLVSGVVRYTPNADFNGIDTFTYTLSDGNGGTATGTVTVTVTAVNDNPVAVNDAITIAEDATATIVPVLANDSFAPDAGETLSVSAVTQPANGSVTLVSGVVRYTPNADFNGTDTFTYTLSDGNGGTATGTVTVTVTAVNDNPLAVNDAITIAEDATATIVPVLANDSFAPDAGETLSVSAVTQPANGTVTLVSGVVRYTPNADFNGIDTFTYTLSDGNGGTATGTVTVTVTAVNDNPVAVNDAITVAEDATATIVPVLANDTFAPDAGETLSVSAVTQPANGTVTLVSGVVRYTPNADFNGTDTFTYTVSDGNGGTATGTVTVTVTASNDAPVAVNDAITVAEDATATIVPVLANDTFAPDAGETLSVSAVTQPANGTVTLVSGVVRYTPNADFNGTDTFTYTVSDGNCGTATGTVTVTVTASNDAPVAVNDAITVAEDATATIVPVLANDTFAPDAGETLSVSAVTQPANGTVTLVSGVVRYTPNADFNGTDTFTYTVSDGNCGTATGTVTVTVTASNDAPVAVNDAITVAEDATATIVPVLANDSFAPDAGETLSVSAVTQPANGSVTLVSGVVRYTPNADFNGIDTFTYTLSDGNGGTATGTVTVTVTAVNDNPVAVNDAITVAEDATATIVPVLANDSFAPDAGETLSVSAVTQPANGSVTLVSGVVRYTPNADFNGTDTFTYTLSDGNGGTATGTVTVTVTAVNDNPLAVNDAITIAEDATATIVPVLANDSFAPDAGETLSVSAVTQPANGTVTLVSGVVRYTPNADFNGIDTFTYTLSDGNGGTATGTVTVTVTAVNDNPVAVNDAITVAEDATATIVPVLANDSFAPDVGETLSVSAVTQPANGTVTLVSGVVRYTPNADFNGTDTFTYTVSDGNGGTATGTVTVTVTAVNDNPVAVNDAITVAEDATATIVPVLANDSFAPDVGETLSVSAVTQPANGTVTLVSGVVRYTPNADFNGTDTFTYTLSDGNGGTATGTVTVTVTASNDAPTAVNDTITVAEDASATIVPVLANDTFAPDVGETLSVSAVTQPANGTVTLVSGVVRYTPNANFNGTDTFTYTLSDGNGGTATGTVTVTVTASNDAPVATPIALQSVQDGAPVTLPTALNFSDIDGDTLTYSATGLPPGLSIDPVTGVISGTVASNASVGGPYTVSLTADDGHGGSVNQSFTWIVSNAAPIVSTGIPDQTGGASRPFSLDISTNFRDGGLDRDTLQFTATGLPAGLTLDPVSGLISGTLPIDAAELGPYVITIMASDGQGGTVSTSFTLTAINDAPVARPDIVTVQQFGTVRISPLANDSDPEGAPLSIVSATASTGSVTINADGTLTYTPASISAGPDVITYTISDGHGGFSTSTVTVDILSGSTFIYSPSGVTDTIPQLPVGNSPQISTEGIVVSTVESFGLGGRFGSLSTDRIVVSSVNRAGSLNGTADLGCTQNPLSAVHRSVEELRNANSLHDRGAGSSGTWSPEGMTGFALHSIAGEQSIDRGIAGSHKIVIEAMVRERALHIQMRDFLFTGSTGSRGWAPSREPAQFTVTLADGRALPDWLSSGGKGLLIGQRPADIEKLELRVVATFADGTSVTRYVRIDAHTGEISQIGEKRAQIEMPKTLSRQFAEAAPMGIDTGELAKLLPL